VKLAALIFAAMFAAATVSACGITTHQEITEQARLGLNPFEHPLLRPLLDRTASNAEFGSAFPDLFWGLDIIFPNYNYREHGNYTHGRGGAVPFNDRFIQILRENYQPPFTDETSAMTAALLLGIGCHQAADDVWHAGLIPQAFAQDGMPEAVVEFGVDLFCEWEQGERVKPLSAVLLPAADLYGIYHAEGYTIGSYHLEIGAAGLRAMLWLEKHIGPSLYLRSQIIMPWTHANYLTYHDGGLDHCRAQCEQFLIETWDELMSTAANPGAPPCLNQLRAESCPPLLALALQLILAGAIDVPIRDIGGGFVEIGEPVIINPLLFQDLINR